MPNLHGGSIHGDNIYLDFHNVVTPLGYQTVVILLRFLGFQTMVGLGGSLKSKQKGLMVILICECVPSTFCMPNYAYAGAHA